MAHDIARTLKHVVLAFIAICCGLMLVWGLSGKVRAAEGAPCVPLAQALANLEAAGFTIAGELRLERFPDARLIVVTKDGYGTILPVLGGCVVPGPAPLGLEGGALPGDRRSRPEIRAPAVPRADT